MPSQCVAADGRDGHDADGRGLGTAGAAAARTPASITILRGEKRVRELAHFRRTVSWPCCAFRVTEYRPRNVLPRMPSRPSGMSCTTDETSFASTSPTANVPITTTEA